MIVGGGRVADRKAAGLLAAGATVAVVAPEICSPLAAREVSVHQRSYRPGEAAHYRLVVAATNDPTTNATVADDANGAGVMVNVVDRSRPGTLTVPAVLRRGQVVVAVSTGGGGPMFAGWVRDRIGAQIGEEYGLAAELLSDTREELMALGRVPGEADWRAALDSDMLKLLRTGYVDRAKELLRRCLSSS